MAKEFAEYVRGLKGFETVHVGASTYKEGKRISGETPHSPDYERYRRGIRYFQKNLPTKIYILNEASMEMCHEKNMTAEELEELAKLAFPGWEGNGDG